MSKFGSLFLDQEQDDSSAPKLEAAQPKARYRLLFIDDEPNVLKSLQRVFRQENYEILTAPEGRAALEILDAHPCHLMITDYKMPGMNGAELLREVKKRHPDTIRIMLTGQADTDAVMAAIKDGAVYKFILKPWNDDDLRVTVALGLEQFDLKQENLKLREVNKQSTLQIEKLAELSVSHRSQLAIMLNKKGLLNDQQVQKLYHERQTKKSSTFDIIVANGWVAEKRIHAILKNDFLFEEVDLAEFRVSDAIAALIPSNICRSQLICPLSLSGRRLALAMVDPLNEGLIGELKFTVGLEIQPLLASSDSIRAKLAEIHGDHQISFRELETVLGNDEPLDQVEVVIDEADEIGIEELLRGTDEPPAIRLVNAILMEATRLGASDIHIQPKAAMVVTRFRIDGVLTEKLQIPASLLMPLVSRIKVMAEMDITERRRPQDGRITLKTPMRVVDLRISTLPTINGEKVVIRILDRCGNIHRLDELGFEKSVLERIDNVIRRPQGIVLATGPTGSGKTTSLYSMLQHIASAEKNYITVEDPVEYYFEQASQVMIKDKIGLDFASVLRAILRQDPDVILIGEIRDQKTAEVAFHAALTGHQVFSTLHTNSAMDTLARLFDFGLQPHLVASAVEAIIAQRLIRVICKHCRVPHTPDPLTISRLGPQFDDPSLTFHIGQGCGSCNGTGFAGRAAIYEVFIPGDSMRQAISEGFSLLKLKQMAMEEGLVSLLFDAKRKVGEGMTSAEEVLRVLGPQKI